MKHILDFIERHKNFFKKLVVFVIAYIVLVIVNNPTFTAFFNEIFGEYITMGFKALPMTILFTGEV